VGDVPLAVLAPELAAPGSLAETVPLIARRRPRRIFWHASLR
jgi:hypothetical protein